LSDLENNLVTLNASKKVNEEDYKRVFLMLREINNITRNRSDQFVILHWNDYKDPVPGTPSFVSKEKMNSLLNDLQKNGAIIINVSDILDIGDSANFIAKDNHPNSVGNGKIAQYLVNRFFKGQAISVAEKQFPVAHK